MLTNELNNILVYRYLVPGNIVYSLLVLRVVIVAEFLYSYLKIAFSASGISRGKNLDGKPAKAFMFVRK